LEIGDYRQIVRIGKIGETFVTRKITHGIDKILAKKEKKIYIGNLETKKDCGYVPEYVM